MFLEMELASTVVSIIGMAMIQVTLDQTHSIKTVLDLQHMHFMDRALQEI